MSVLQYGSYRHQPGEVTLRPIARNAMVAPSAIVYGWTWRWKVSGFLQATSQANLTAAIQRLEAAYAVQGGNLGFFNDDGSATAHGIFDGQTIGGVRVVSGPNYPEGQGAEYSAGGAFRFYEIELEYDVRDFRVGLLAWTESITYSGGGPEFIFLEPILGPPVKQLLKAATAFRAVQRGMAKGHGSYPVPPDPLWPGDLLRDPEVERIAPQRRGNAFIEPQISWTYTFASALPLVGLPNPQPNI